MAWKACTCQRGQYDDHDGRYTSCHQCYLDRRAEFTECLYCGRWHGLKFDACFKCSDKGRSEAAKHIKLMVHTRDRFRCRNCESEKDLQVDHIRPCAKGGTADPWNLQSLCANCNHLKSDNFGPDQAKRLEWQIAQYLGGLWEYLTCVEKDRLCAEANVVFGYVTLSLGREPCGECAVCK